MADHCQTPLLQLIKSLYSHRIGLGPIIILPMTSKISTLTPKSVNVVLDYSLLMSGGKQYYQEIEAAYGSKGHGILMVENIPGFEDLRKKYLPFAHRVANLPVDKLKKYIRPDIFHSLGWSCGVEQFHGKYDVSKGSFYFKAAQDQPPKLRSDEEPFYTKEQILMRQSNKWIDQIPELQKYSKEMSKLMVGVGALVARQIDAYVEKVLPAPMKISMSDLVTRGTTHVGRLLHYFPFEAKQSSNQTQDDWCGWHNDHSALTALTSSMYLDKDGKQIEFTETNGGLFAKNRTSQITKILIPKNMLAFQLGEAAQILTGGVLEATPHCVIKSDELSGKGVSRNSLALFMGPEQLVKMEVPNGVDPKNACNNAAYKIPPLQGRWQNGIFYKEFNNRTLKEYS